jgi:hypothetical protein
MTGNRKLVLKTSHPDLETKRGQPMLLSNRRDLGSNEAIAAYLTSQANHKGY